MHGLADQAEFYHRTIMRDEARVGGAAGRRQFRLASSHLGDRVRDCFGERAGLGDEHAGVRWFELEREFDLAARRFRRARFEQRLERVQTMAIVEPNIETRPRLAGNEIDGLVADIDRGEFEVRRLERRATLVERLRLQRADQRDDVAHRIVGALRIGDMAGLAGDDQRAVERAAATDLAMPPFMSTAPRPYNWPLSTAPENGGCDQAFSSPTGTTSVWPANIRCGPALPMRA